eukprot:4786547-Prymnesium_polylepis.1
MAEVRHIGIGSDWAANAAAAPLGVAWARVGTPRRQLPPHAGAPGYMSPRAQPSRTVLDGVPAGASLHTARRLPLDVVKRHVSATCSAKGATVRSRANVYMWVPDLGLSLRARP